MTTNFEKITKDSEVLAHYLAGIINGECSDKCPGYPYCNGSNCDLAIEQFLADDTLTTFKEVNIGDRFKVANALDRDTVYIKTGEITTPTTVTLNCVNLKNGYYGYIKPLTQVRITKKCEK